MLSELSSSGEEDGDKTSSDSQRDRDAGELLELSQLRPVVSFAFAHPILPTAIDSSSELVRTKRRLSVFHQPAGRDQLPLPLHHETRQWRKNVLGRRLVRKVEDLPRRNDLDPRARQSLSRPIQHLLQDLLLALAARHERHTVRVVENGESEGDARRGRLGRVVQPGDPAVNFVEEGMAWEEGTGVAVGSAMR